MGEIKSWSSGEGRIKRREVRGSNPPINKKKKKKLTTQTINICH